jgi:dUTP pyrophosphatase
VTPSPLDAAPGGALLGVTGVHAMPMHAPLTVKVRRVRAHPDPLPLPRYHSAQAAGLDLQADIDGELTLGPLERAAVPTGLAVALPPGYEGQVRPRSGLALRHGVTLLNSPGTLDADYRGELQVVLVNLSGTPFTLRRGERVAQLVVAPVSRVALEEVQVLDETERGPGGFGSTGL